MLETNNRPIDVFISHSSDDGEFAKELCAAIEKSGYRCWISSRDITAGMDWSSSITHAIEQSSVVLVIYSRNSSRSTQVPKEITLAENKGSYIIPYKIDDMPLTEYYEYHLANSHWIQYDAQSGDMKLAELCGAIASVTGKTATPAAYVPSAATSQYTKPVNAPSVPSAETTTTTKSNKNIIPIIVIIALIVCIGVLAAILLLNGSDDKNDDHDRDDRVVTEEQDSNNHSDNEEEEDEDDNDAEVDDDSSDTSVEENISSDIVYVPQDMLPYETKNVTILNDDPYESYAVLGESYNTGMLLQTKESDTYALFNIGGKYDTMLFTVVRADGNDAGSDSVLHIFVDGEEVHSVKLPRHGLPQQVYVDVKGAQQVSLTTDYHYGGPDVAITQCTFSNGKPEETTQENTQLAEGTVRVPQDFLPYESKYATVLNDDPYESFSLLGESYNTGVLLHTRESDNYTLFNIDGAYETIQFVAMRVDGNNAGSDSVLRIIVDGEEKHHVQLARHGLPQIVSVDVKGARQVKLTSDYHYAGPDIALTEFTFSTGAKPEIKSELAPLATTPAAVPHDIMPYESQYITALDNDPYNSYSVLGEKFNTGLLLQTSQSDNFAVFNINGAYETLQFIAARTDGNHTAADSKLHIIVDGVEKHSVTLPRHSAPQIVSVDVKGARQIKFTVDYHYNGPDIALMQLTLSAGTVPETDNVLPVFDSATVTAPDGILPYDTNYATILNNDPYESHDVNGIQCNTGVFLKSSESDNFVVFSMGGAFKKLDFTAACADVTDGTNNVVLRVYADGKEVHAFTLSGDGQPQAIFADISGAAVVKITVDYLYHGPLVAMTDITFS